MLKSKLNVGNLMKTINTFAANVVLYTVSEQKQLESLNKMTRKQLAPYRALHTKPNIYRLYVERKTGQKRLVRIEDLVRKKGRQLICLTKNSKTPVIRAVAGSQLEKWMGMVMRGLFVRHQKNREGIKARCEKPGNCPCLENFR